MHECHCYIVVWVVFVNRTVTGSTATKIKHIYVISVPMIKTRRPFETHGVLLLGMNDELCFLVFCFGCCLSTLRPYLVIFVQLFILTCK